MFDVIELRIGRLTIGASKAHNRVLGVESFAVGGLEFLA